MEKQTHTPGPWVIQQAKTGDTLAMIRAALPGYSGTRKIAEVTDVGSAGEANARLIAAAPELLAELTRLVRALEPKEQTGLDLPGIATLNAARAAIAKATA